MSAVGGKAVAEKTETETNRALPQSHCNSAHGSIPSLEPPCVPCLSRAVGPSRSCSLRRWGRWSGTAVSTRDLSYRARRSGGRAGGSRWEAAPSQFETSEPPFQPYSHGFPPVVARVLLRREICRVVVHPEAAESRVTRQVRGKPMAKAQGEGHLSAGAGLPG